MDFVTVRWSQASCFPVSCLCASQAKLTVSWLHIHCTDFSSDLQKEAKNRFLQELFLFLSSGPLFSLNLSLHLFLSPLPADWDPLRAPEVPDIRGRTPALWLLSQSKIFALYRHSTDTRRSTDHQARLTSPLPPAPQVVCEARTQSQMTMHTHHSAPVTSSSITHHATLQQHSDRKRGSGDVKLELIHFSPFPFVINPDLIWWSFEGGCVRSIFRFLSLR